MANVKQWEEYFDGLPEPDLKKIQDALTLLSHYSMLYSEFHWTGLFDLRFLISVESHRRLGEGVNRE